MYQEVIKSFKTTTARNPVCEWHPTVVLTEESTVNLIYVLINNSFLFLVSHLILNMGPHWGLAESHQFCIQENSNKALCFC
jgi:hypothetical protein